MICPWPMIYPGCNGQASAEPCGDLAEVDEQMRQYIEEMATEMLWEATGRTFGVCQIEVRPCRVGCAGAADWASTYWGRGPGFDPMFPRLGGGSGGGSFYPVLVSGQWYNVTCGCLGSCRCEPSGPATLSLPGPAQSVVSVTIDGVPVPPTAYRLDRNRWLIRTDGGVWPGCQDMNAAPDEPGSFVVTYMRGVPVPSGGRIAAGLLSQQIAMLLCGNDDCDLPENWQTLTRQGITVQASSSESPWTETGIWLIDSWVYRMNTPRPYSTVRSVDVPRRH